MTKWKLFKQREKPPRGCQTQEIHYLEEIASRTHKSHCSSRTLNSNTYLYVSASLLDHLSEGFFNELL
jgi:hypothetical protein